MLVLGQKELLVAHRFKLSNSNPTTKLRHSFTMVYAYEIFDYSSHFASYKFSSQMCFVPNFHDCLLGKLSKQWVSICWVGVVLVFCFRTLCGESLILLVWGLILFLKGCFGFGRGNRGLIGIGLSLCEGFVVFIEENQLENRSYY